MHFIVYGYRNAEKFRESEFNAALKLQSWYRGCKLRAYIRFDFVLHTSIIM